VRKVDQAKYDAKRRHILEAARACFLRDGFRGASISDICAAARMSPGHLYHYFTSKEAIVKAIVEWGLEQSAAVFDKLTNTEHIVDALVTELDRRLTRERHRGVSFTLEMLAESARNPAIAEIVRRRDRVRCELLSRLLRAGQEREQVDPGLDPDIAAALVSHIMETIGYLALRDPRFDMQGGADMLKVLMTRFLDPRATPAADRRLPETTQKERTDKRQPPRAR